MKGWGDDTEPLWKYLKENSPNCKITKEVWWNFEKVLVDKDGKVFQMCLLFLAQPHAHFLHSENFRILPTLLFLNYQIGSR